MTTSVPLILNTTTGNPAQIPSTSKLGPFAGGTATGEAMTQDQFGANSTQMQPSGAPTFASVTATALIDAPLLSHSGHIDITPSSGNRLDLNVAGSGGGLRVLSTGADAIVFDRSSNTDNGTTISYSTASSAKWSIGPASGSESWRIFNTTAGLNSISIDGTTGIPTLLTPILGIPTSGTLTNCTGLPISSGVSGLGTGVGTALGINVGSAGSFVVNGGALGTPSSGSLANCTGLPISSGVSGLGTGVATALAINVGTSGSFVTNGGALGTPSSGTVTNLSGTASININGTVGATTPAAGTFTTLASTGNSTFGDATGDGITFNADAWTFPTGVTISKTAETGVAETIMTWKVSDSSSTFVVKNGTANASAFAPVFEGVIEASVNSTALSFFGTKGANDTTNPAILLLGRYNSGSGNTDLSDTTVIVEIRNRATSIVKFFPVSMTFVKDPYDIVLGTSTGTKIGTATTQKLGFYNATPIVQRSGAAQAAVATTAATQTTPWGFTTQAQADAIVTLVNELRAWAVAQGFIKGSA